MLFETLRVFPDAVVIVVAAVVAVIAVVVVAVAVAVVVVAVVVAIVAVVVVVVGKLTWSSYQRLTQLLLAQLHVFAGCSD